MQRTHTTIAQDGPRRHQVTARTYILLYRWKPIVFSRLFRAPTVFFHINRPRYFFSSRFYFRTINCIPTRHAYSVRHSEPRGFSRPIGRWTLQATCFSQRCCCCCRCTDNTRSLGLNRSLSMLIAECVARVVALCALFACCCSIFITS